jgi:hypothetical protein
MKTCVHLEALERELEARGVSLDVVQSPYNVGGLWLGVSCTFDEPSLRGRYVMGLHPRYAPKWVPHLR